MTPKQTSRQVMELRNGVRGEHQSQSNLKSALTFLASGLIAFHKGRHAWNGATPQYWPLM